MTDHNTPHLLLLLDGPMQAWGYLSLFDRRNSLHYPTRSALVGMFCAASGIDRADTSGLRRWDRLLLEVIAYCKRPARIRPKERAGVSTGSRRLEVRRWIDFHTIGGGYDKKTHRYFVPFSAEGKPRGSVITQREYLADACFVVLVRAADPTDEGLLTELCHNLCHPRWGIWLGRKCCVPSFPICHKVHPSRQEAFACLKRLSEWRPLDLTRPLRHVIEVDRFQDGTDTLFDVPVDFRQRQFRPRRVQEIIGPID